MRAVWAPHAMKVHRLYFNVGVYLRSSSRGSTRSARARTSRSNASRPAASSTARAERSATPRATGCPYRRRPHRGAAAPSDRAVAPGDAGGDRALRRGGDRAGGGATHHGVAARRTGTRLSRRASCPSAPPVDLEHLAGDVARVGRAEVRDRGGDVLGRARHGRAGPGRDVVGEASRSSASRPGRGDRVDGHAEARPLLRHRLRQADHAGLGRGVVGRADAPWTPAIEAMLTTRRAGLGARRGTTARPRGSR